MTQLIFLIAFISTEKRKIHSNAECRYKFAHKGMTKYLLLCLDREYKQ